MRWVKLLEIDPLFISSSIPDCLGPYFSTWAPRLWPNLRYQICSASTIVVKFLACWHYWILIRRVCDLSVGATLQPEMRTTSSTTSQQFCLPIAWLVWWVCYNCWFHFQMVSENQSGTSSRTTFKMRIGTSLAILFTNVGQLVSWVGGCRTSVVWVGIDL